MSSKIQIISNNRQGQLNTAFLATVPGVLKIAEIVGIIFVNRNELYLYEDDNKNAQRELGSHKEKLRIILLPLNFPVLKNKF